MRNIIVFLIFVIVLSLGYGQDRKGLAVLEFRVEGDAPKASGKVIADLITNRIKLDQYFIVERARLSEILKERLINLGDSLSQEDINNLRNLGVSFVMIGQIAIIENKYYGGYRIVDVNNARIGESDAIVNAENFSDFVEKIYLSLISKEFIKDKVSAVVKSSWLEQYKQDIENKLEKVEKENEELKKQIAMGQAKTNSIFIGGDLQHWYPVFFSDEGWDHGAFVVEISRAYVHLDNRWQGSVISRFRSHSSHWGGGSDFVEADIHNNVAHHIADYTSAYYGKGLVVWLRGASTYYYRTNHPTQIKWGEEIITFTCSDPVVCEKYTVKDKIDPKAMDGYHYQGNITASKFTTGDIVFEKNGDILWRMFEEENAIYLQNMKTGKLYTLVLQEAPK